MLFLSTRKNFLHSIWRIELEIIVTVTVIPALVCSRAMQHLTRRRYLCFFRYKIFRFGLDCKTVVFFLPYLEGTGRRNLNPRVWSARASHARSFSVSPQLSSPFIHSLQTFRPNTARVAWIRRNATVLKSSFRQAQQFYSACNRYHYVLRQYSPKYSAFCPLPIIAVVFLHRPIFQLDILPHNTFNFGSFGLSHPFRIHPPFWTRLVWSWLKLARLFQSCFSPSHGRPTSFPGLFPKAFPPFQFLREKPWGRGWRFRETLNS